MKCNKSLLILPEIIIILVAAPQNSPVQHLDWQQLDLQGEILTRLLQLAQNRIILTQSVAEVAIQISAVYPETKDWLI